MYKNSACRKSPSCGSAPIFFAVSTDKSYVLTAFAGTMIRRARSCEFARSSRFIAKSYGLKAVQTATEEAGFSVVRSLVGHGVGRAMHEDPQIPNFGVPGRGPLLAEGMTFAIEPMITAGGPDVVVHDDEWSISTSDGSLAAHFEHTVAITESGPQILTAAAVLLR